MKLSALAMSADLVSRTDSTSVWIATYIGLVAGGTLLFIPMYVPPPGTLLQPRDLLYMRTSIYAGFRSYSLYRSTEAQG